MYRLGNSNAVSLSSLFKLTTGKNIDNRNVNLSIYDASKTSGDNVLTNIATSGTGFSATYTKELTGRNWTESTIKFCGSGVAIIEIGIGTFLTRLAVEVIDGKNITNASQLGGSENNIIINDLNYTGSGQFSINKITLYGNGFEINAEKYVSSTNSMISLSNGVIDNVIINGPVYPEVVYGSNNKYYASGIEVYNDCKIYNSYISGFRSPIKCQSGTLLLDNTTLYGGVYSNLHVFSLKKLTLNNVTTVQKAQQATVGDNLTNKVLGAGIVFSEDNATANTELIINGELIQYNWVNESDSGFLPDNYESVFKGIFSNSNYASFIHTVDGVKYINTGIVFSGERTNIGNDNRTNKNQVPYSSIILSVLEYKGTVYTYNNSLGSVNASSMIYNGYASSKQTKIAPVFSFTNLGSLPTDSDEIYYYYDGTIHIGIPSNGSYELDLSEGVTIKKYTNNYAYNITSSDCTISNTECVFSKKGNYTIVYQVSDNQFYDINGNRINEIIDYTFEIDIEVSIASIPDAIISFDSSNDVLYGQTGFFWDYDYYVCVPILQGLKITDYNENGEIDVSISPTALPADLSVSVSGVYVFDDGGSFRTYKEKLYYCSTKPADNKINGTVTVTYSYVGGNNKTITAVKTFSITKTTSDVKFANFKEVN